MKCGLIEILKLHTPSSETNREPSGQSGNEKELGSSGPGEEEEEGMSLLSGLRNQ